MSVAPAREFAVILSAGKLSTKRLAHRIGNPLAKAATPWYEREAIVDWLEKRGRFYAAGTNEHPCGRWPNGPKGAVSGDHHDDEGFSFFSLYQPVMWASVWVPQATTLRAGQMLRLQTTTGW